jgi:hypothetical protein
VVVVETQDALVAFVITALLMMLLNNGIGIKVKDILHQQIMYLLVTVSI